MKVSWNWLSEMVDLSQVGGPQGLAQLLTSRGLEVEEIHSQSKGFEKVVTVQILEREKHPQSDRLSLCRVTTGKGEPLEIVCGAQNMKVGDRVALAQIGAELPNGLKIAQSKIRGSVSNGMLCSEEELKLKDKSEGILILPPETPLGLPLAQVLGRDDTVFTLKLTANRGDCLSHFGLAREIAAALGQKAKRPTAKTVGTQRAPIEVKLDAGKDGPQFVGAWIEGVKVGPSPDWVVRRLETLGSRSINNVVDASNLVMLELGHPTHAYDGDRLEGGVIGIRFSHKGETLPLLDGKTITLDSSELVIADAKKAVGLAGVMGGGNSEVLPTTTRVFLECAEFSPSLVRRAAARHQRRTDAAQRFEKGIDPTGLYPALSRLASLIQEFAGGTVAGMAAAFTPERSPTTNFARKISVPVGYFASFLGMNLAPGQAEQTLESLECQIEKSEAQWLVQVPPYRLDLNSREDLAEEVARSVGYDQIPSTVPKLSSVPSSLSTNESGMKLAVMNRAKDSLAASGLSETLNYGFSSRAWLSKLGFDSAATVVNPLSEEHEVMVPSLLPGIIQSALQNWRHHFGSEALPIRLFEIRPTFHLAEGVSSASAQGQFETGVLEKWRLSLALSGPRFASALRSDLGEVDFFDLKGILEDLFARLGTRGVRVLPFSGKFDTPTARLFHPGQTAEIWLGNSMAGFAGLLHPAQSKELKTRAPLWLVELDWDAIYKISRSATEGIVYRPWAEFPSMERDFALLVKDGISAEKITQLALKAGRPLAKVAKIFDVYRGSQVAEGMTSVAVRVIFSEEGRSLQESEAEETSNRILEVWKKELGAQLRS